jgi:GMP synthase (glutamine-hydrolysing)
MEYLKEELVLVLDFGGQYNQLIARRVREAHVYCEMIPFFTPIEEIEKKNPKAIIFSGGPSSVYGEKAPTLDKRIYELGIPILGICYGMQLMALDLGGEVQKATDTREYGKTELNILSEDALMQGLPSSQQCWMSHGDFINKAPEGYTVTSKTDSSPVTSMANAETKMYGVQFHPEVNHTVYGQDMLKHFLYDVVGLEGSWSMSSFIDTEVNRIREMVGDKRVLCALSGGVDSAVAALLVNRAISENLICVYVDHGLMRKNETEQVKKTFKGEFGLNLICVDAKERFLSKLEGVGDPEKKRKIIGEEFIRVLKRKQISWVRWISWSREPCIPM